MANSNKVSISEPESIDVMVELSKIQASRVAHAVTKAMEEFHMQLDPTRPLPQAHIERFAWAIVNAKLAKQHDVVMRCLGSVPVHMRMVFMGQRVPTDLLLEGIQFKRRVAYIHQTLSNERKK